jgi:hypothetical protein
LEITSEEKIKKELIEFLNGDKNFYVGELTLGREKTSKTELIFVGYPDFNKPLYSFFNSSKSKKKYLIKQTAEGFVIERKKLKGTGGKPAYVSLMLSEFEKAQKKLSHISAGIFIKLSNNIEWNTGRLIRTRDGSPLTKKMISEMFSLNDWNVRLLLKEFSNAGVITYDRKKHAYFVNPNILRKGMKT